jgi:tetratricopeptide (TPR) repeat protein
LGIETLRILAAGLAGCVLAFGAQAADAPDPHAAMQDVANALRAGQAGVAEHDAGTILDIDTITPLDRAHTLLNRALAREALGKQQDALSDFNNAIWLNILPPREKARALFDRGVTLDELGRTADAIADYSAALTIQPDYAAALNDRANAERRLGKLPEAKADYEASLAAGNTEKKYPLFGLGEIAVIQGDTATAQNDFKAALAQDARYTVATQRLASLQAVPPVTKLHEPEKPQAKLAEASPPAPKAAEAPPPPKVAEAPHLRGIEDVPTRDMHETKVASLDTPHIPQVTSGGATLQFGAFRSEAEAQSGWKALLSKTGGTLDGVAPAIVAADVPGKGRFWRLRVGPLDKDRAASICDRIKAKGAACFPARD